MDVAVTGIGIVSPLGCDTAVYFEKLKLGELCIEAVALPNDPEERQIWCSTVRSVELPDWCDEKIIAGTDVLTQWALTAAERALQHSMLQPDPLRTAVIHGTSLCGVQSVMRAQYEIDAHGPGAFPRKTMMKALTNMPAAQICMRHQLHGPSLTLTTACAATLDAIGTAARMIASDLCDMAIVGGTEAGENLVSGGMDGGFVPAMAYAPAAFGMQSPANEPHMASMPFDIKRSGVVGSEGSAFFILECAKSASARNANVLGYIRGYGSIADAFHPSAPDPSGQWEARAMELALADAGIQAGEVNALIAHGTATPKGDTAEIRAINRVHKTRSSPLAVTSTKGNFGHAAAASGGMSLIAGLLGMAESTLVHTANTDEPDPAAEFDIVIGKSRELNIDILQINAFGFGGQNASIVVSRN